MKIISVTAYEILASGGYPTVEARVELEGGFVGVASVPYGASAGSHEASVLMDGDKSRYNGQGMLGVVKTIQEVIASLVIGLDAADQRSLDETMIQADGTPNKSKLGGNAILAVSLAAAQAEASAQHQPFYKHIAETFQTGVDFSNLPSPMVVVIEGGKHADDTTDLQEFCISAIGDGTAAEKVRQAMETYHALKKVLKANKLSTNVGNEGAFAPNGIPSNEAPFQYILEAIKAAGYEAGKDLSISIDAAASEFYHDGKYDLKVEQRQLTAAELIAYYETWLQKYPIVSIEDMLAEDDWDNWVLLKQLSDRYQVELIGDDLTVTNLERLQKAIDLDAISSILIKLNQIGTLTETVDCCMLARKHGLMTTTSH
jgi:enolase